MANRYLSQFHYSLEKQPVSLFAQATIAASGAPTLVAAKSKGIKSIVRNSAGRYTITLNDKFTDLLQLTASLTLASGDPAAVSMVVRTVSVSAATPTVVVEFLDETAAAVDPASGVTLRLALTLKNSSV